MPSISAKIVEAFRNLRSDAVPRDPRPPPQRPQETPEDVTGETQVNETESSHSNESESTNSHQEEIFVEPENINKHEKAKKVFNFGKTKKSDSSKPKDKNSGSKVYNVNTQATGSVITVLGSPGFRWGNDFVYNLGPTQNNSHNHNKTEHFDNNDEEHIVKNNDIILLMEAKISPEHDYIDYISKNLGKNWHYIFRKLGFTKGRIETFEIDESRNGVSEARYKLLLDWMHNDEDGSLGRLANILWAEGERQIVKDLSIIYSTKNKDH